MSDCRDKPCMSHYPEFDNYCALKGQGCTYYEPIDIGNLCVHCRQDTSFGSGRFVNRYPVFGFENIDTEQEEDGYCCDECEQGGV
mgnify:CR=1 FL=1